MVNNSLKIFISHSNYDREAAFAIINLLKAALNLKPSEIRCTSIDGYRLPVGADTDERLREEVLAAAAFIGIISPSSIASAYVMFELGGRWGAKKFLAPLLAPGVLPDVLKGPIAGLNVLSCSSESQLHQLVGDLAREIGVAINSPAAYLLEVRAVTSAVASLENPKQKDQVVTQDSESKGRFVSKTEYIDAIKVFVLLDGRASTPELARQCSWTLVKAQHFVDELSTLKLIEFNESFQAGHLVFRLTRKGRAFAVENDLA